MTTDRYNHELWFHLLENQRKHPVIPLHAVSYARITMERHRQAARRVTLLLSALCCVVIWFVVQLFI